MGDQQYLTVGEFTRAMGAMESRLTDRFHALDGRLSAISRDARDTRDAVVDHKVRIAVLESDQRKAKTKVAAWSAAWSAVVLGAAEGIRRFLTP